MQYRNVTIRLDIITDFLYLFILYGGVCWHSEKKIHSENEKCPIKAIP